MFRNCLIGSICLHILILVGVGLCLPRLSHPSPQSVVYFDVVGSTKSDQASSEGSGNGPAGEAGDNLAVKPGVEANPSRRSPIFSPGSVKPEPDSQTSPDSTVLTAAGEGPGTPGPTETPGTAVQSGSPVEYASGTGNSMAALGGLGAGNHGNGSPGMGETGDPKIYGAGGVEGAAPDISPQKTYQAAPVYPEAARRNNWEGDTVLQALISSDGKPGSITVVSSSGHPQLDQAAIRAVRRWRYRPANQGGKPVACYIRITIHFKLED